MVEISSTRAAVDLVVSRMLNLGIIINDCLFVRTSCVAYPSYSSRKVAKLDISALLNESEGYKTCQLLVKYNYREDN